MLCFPLVEIDNDLYCHALFYQVFSPHKNNPKRSSHFLEDIHICSPYIFIFKLEKKTPLRLEITLDVICTQSQHN